MHKTGSKHAPHAMALPLGAIVAAMRRDPDKMRILSACTLAAVAVVFEPPYLTLSTSLVQVGLRAESIPAPAYLAVGFLLLALLTLLAGTSADIFGRRLFLLIGLAGLTLSNILGLLWLDTPKAFVVADMMNAVSGVLVLPAAVAIVTLTFEKALRPFAYGILFAIQGTAMVLGMLLIPALGDVGKAARRSSRCWFSASSPSCWSYGVCRKVERPSRSVAGASSRNSCSWAVCS